MAGDPARDGRALRAGRRDVTCPRCGAPLPPGAGFCRACSAPIGH
ncbi:zinc-ribbon domain-containing protein [Streptomyces sp. NPDC029554]